METPEVDDRERILLLIHVFPGTPRGSPLTRATRRLFKLSRGERTRRRLARAGEESFSPPVAGCGITPRSIQHLTSESRAPGGRSPPDPGPPREGPGPRAPAAESLGSLAYQSRSNEDLEDPWSPVDIKSRRARESRCYIDTIAIYSSKHVWLIYYVIFNQDFHLRIRIRTYNVLISIVGRPACGGPGPDVSAAGHMCEHEYMYTLHGMYVVREPAPGCPTGTTRARALTCMNA